jgi:uncharacterized sulfatase
VGQLVKHIELVGLAEETIFVFVCDNGFVPDPKQPIAGGDFNFTKTSKRSPFEDGLRTQILIRWDGHAKAATHQNLCSSVDLVPTLLDALGFPDAIANLPGQSLRPSATGREPLSAPPSLGKSTPAMRPP